MVGLIILNHFQNYKLFILKFTEYESYVEEKGSWFITSLCEVFNEKYKEWDIFQMLSYVNKQVVSRDFQVQKKGKIKIFKQMPQMVSTLRKFLKFSRE